MNTHQQPSISDTIRQDVRYSESLKACMNCGICTAICPAAAFYNDDPRQICNQVQNNNETDIDNLLNSDTIWYCGQCMSCKTRCPRQNVPGMLIQILRKVSQQTGMFMHSEMGKLQRDIVENIGNNLYQTGYCVTPDLLIPQNHPEQGPVWEWVIDHKKPLFEKLQTAYGTETEGALRNIPNDAMDELHAIFEITGCLDFFEQILTPKTSTNSSPTS